MNCGPTFVGEVEITKPLPKVPAIHKDQGVRYANANLLIRLGSEPIGVVEVALPLERPLADLIWDSYADLIQQRLAAIGADDLVRLTASGISLTCEQLVALPWASERIAVLADPPSISVVMCTRDPDDSLELALDAVAALEYPDFEIVLVDNASTSAYARELVRSARWKVPVRYVDEPRPGLSWARNAGVRHARGSLVAFIDDDEVPDRHWLAEYARAFHRVPSAGVASGLILARSLDTEAERFFERLGGHSKGRGFRMSVFDVASHAEQHPLYPLPPFGAGGNMCFRREVLGAIGCFDVALGAGTPTHGAEDTAAIADAMLAGFTAVWQPSAFVRHRHYDTLSGATAQLRGYSIGLSAFYTRMVVNDLRRIRTLVRLVPRAVADLRSPGTTLIGARTYSAPERLRRAQLTGLALGPVAYAWSRRLQRRLARSHGS